MFNKVPGDIKSSIIESLHFPNRTEISREQNFSYARRESHTNDAHVTANRRSGAQELDDINKKKENDDMRFLRMAQEALIATAKGVNPLQRASVDPTISDLLKRLQYATSPHGNPMKRSESITANEDGQLMIQNFYQDFPNLSNDVFLDTSSGSSTTFLDDYTGSSGSNISELRNQYWEVNGGDPHHDLVSTRQKESQMLEEKKFACQNCSMTFRRSSDLKRHEKQHLSTPPNICEMCGKGFARKDALKRHSGTLTCKRNAKRKLYVHNLAYIDKSVNSSAHHF